MEERFMIRADLFVLGVEFLRFLVYVTYQDWFKDRQRMHSKGESFSHVIIPENPLYEWQNPRNFSVMVAVRLFEEHEDMRRVMSRLTSGLGEPLEWLVTIADTLRRSEILHVVIDAAPIISRMQDHSRFFFQSIKDGRLTEDYLCGRTVSPYR